MFEGSGGGGNRVLRSKRWREVHRVLRSMRWRAGDRMLRSTRWRAGNRMLRSTRWRVCNRMLRSARWGGFDRMLRSTRISGLKPGGVVFALKCGRSGAPGPYIGGVTHIVGGRGGALVCSVDVYYYDEVFMSLFTKCRCYICQEIPFGFYL